MPDSTVSAASFAVWSSVVTTTGTEPTDKELAQLELYRAEFETDAVPRAAQDRATANSRLRRMVRLSTWPAAGVLAGNDGVADLEIAAPAEADLTFAISTDSSLFDGAGVRHNSGGLEQRELRPAWVAGGV